MWERFTESALETLSLAQEEAVRRGDEQLSTEHLLLALTRRGREVGAVFEALGIAPEEVGATVQRHLPGRRETYDTRISPLLKLTPAADRTLQLAYVEARNLGDSYIGAEHLLLALLHDGSGLAGMVLIRHLGLTLILARKAVSARRMAEAGDTDTQHLAPGTQRLDSGTQRLDSGARRGATGTSAEVLLPRIGGMLRELLREQPHLRGIPSADLLALLLAGHPIRMPRPSEP